MSVTAAIAIGLVLIGCCTNVVFLELIIRYDSGAGNLITFGQFLFIALEGFIFTADFGRKKPVIPIAKYATMVAFFFTVSVSNNFCFYFKIPLPLHMIFRAGSLIANMILGVIILKKQYPFSKYLSVLMITFGIFLCTLLSARDVKSDDEDEDNVTYKYVMWLCGIGVLTFALFLSARMGLYQEVLYSSYGKHPREALFYTHALPLAGFLLIGKDIYNHCVILSQSESFEAFGVTIPEQWLYFLGNVVTQYVCIRGVFILTTECPSLVVTLVITLRKFISLIFSILYFKNPFTIGHWIGTFMVFSGVLLFTEAIQKLYSATFAPKKEAVKVD
ncbi:UDP-xylose and UDP-N-acetylglucosamine transporter [Holothuria leucospilota]|uniref:UDP-xylose and UDP-N-acetylglucosamine transporter n=1 Tax=Holothuria leucospilota TaxID=206669 RepID=A0A9Q1CKM7_HOLLE|nr:UDP-xylose and UDP-N-acetylglucosamine transporter [Holothuria leucospilota]